MTDHRETISARRGRQAVTLGPSAGQSEESIDADIERSFSFADRLAEQGTERWVSRYRWWGPFKFLVAKEVGPPPWKWPQVHFDVKRRPLHLSMVAGWRSTGYRFHVAWMSHNRQSGT